MWYGRSEVTPAGSHLQQRNDIPDLLTKVGLGDVAYHKPKGLILNSGVKESGLVSALWVVSVPLPSSVLVAIALCNGHPGGETSRY